MTEVSEWVTERLAAALEPLLQERDGTAPQAQWPAEDGWLIVYTTGRVKGGPHAGRFVTMAYKPTGPGSRSGNPQRWTRVYSRAYSTRKAAKMRALQLYSDHSPKWAARNAARWGLRRKP